MAPSVPLDLWSWPGWTWPGWAALAAIGAAIAAIGTVAAFFVIRAQLQEARREARENREAAVTPVLFLAPSLAKSGRDRVLDLRLHLEGTGAIYGANIRFVANQPAELDLIELRPREPRDIPTQRAPVETGAGSYAWKWESSWKAVRGRIELHFINALNERMVLIQPAWLGEDFIRDGAPVLKRSSGGPSDG